MRCQSQESSGNRCIPVILAQHLHPCVEKRIISAALLHTLLSQQDAPLSRSLLCLQLPVKMVRCWQHATLAVQLASSAASSGPAWARKSSSFVAAPPIAEEDSGAEASSQSASPSPPVPLAAGALNGTGSAVAAAVSSRKEAALAAQPSHVGQRSAHGAAVLPQAASASDEGQPASLPWQNGADVPLGNGIALNDAAGAQGVTRADSNDRGAQPQQALSGSHGAAPTHAGDVFREPQPCGGSAGGSLPPTSRGLSAAAQPAAVQPGGNETSARESRYIEGRVAGSCVKLAQLHPAGSMAAQQRILADSAGGISRQIPSIAPPTDDQHIRLRDSSGPDDHRGPRN